MSSVILLTPLTLSSEEELASLQLPGATSHGLLYIFVFYLFSDELLRIQHIKLLAPLLYDHRAEAC